MSTGRTDFHSHILPGIDDGAENLAESLAMAEAAWRVGYTEIIATPHYEEGFLENERSFILHQVQILETKLRHRGIPVKLSPGCEVMLSPEIPRLLKAGCLMTMRDDGLHLLVELPLEIKPIWTDDVLHQIRLLGLTPVLAHPERHSWLEGNEEWLRKIKARGVLLQCNHSSLADKYGSSVRKKAEYYQRQPGLVDYWGSDAHSAKGYEILGNMSNVK